MLEADSGLLPNFRHFGSDIPASDNRVAISGRQHTGEHADGRRLSSSVVPYAY